ncbi:MAG: hypothetical protein AAB884_00805 [Patescibacteria group bacterium]
MKKIALAMFLLVFAGITFAETPKIVNPPRPTREYKRLLLVQHGDSERIHNLFLYTNGTWSVVRSNDSGGLWLKFESAESVEEWDFSEEKYGPFYSSVWPYYVLLESGNDRLLMFLQTKAPKPLNKTGRKFSKVEIKPTAFRFNEKKVNHPKSQKAKVVFTK